MVNQWNPQMERERLSGPSASTLGAWGFGTALGVIIIGAALLVAMSVSGLGYLEHPALTLLMILWVLDGVGAISFLWMTFYWALPRERRAGYSTSPREGADLDYVDSKTGGVIRCAGEERIDSHEEVRRIRLIREAHAMGTKE
ncbi:hypothetical protein [Myceligenerans indicum]|uniref:Uncharacterized protein n=1 Tax=Myceligenerans indicum TaxID=2593663 RepID=A0ABS1LIC0_9MICO|nr:hypothetical protein [Myceligenerans indicum]MBL0885893.1 hypothetical protein [Myceligenerans indicum]